MHNGVVGDAEFVQLLKQLADMHVMLDHAVRILVLAGNAAQFLLYMGAEMHARPVPPHEERLFRFVSPVDEVEGAGQRLLVDRLHTLLGQRAGVLDLAVRERPDDAAGPESFPELRILGIILILGFFFSIEVIEVAEKLVETVIGRQHIVSITEVVLAELTGNIALRLEQSSNGRIFYSHALLGARQADLG